LGVHEAASPGDSFYSLLPVKVLQALLQVL
jgi:hypothetical protein